MGESTQLTRNVRLRAGKNPGEHEFTLATQGEASDGHILSMAGGHIADRMPMFDGHFNSATDTMGSVINPVKRLGADPPALDVTFQIELGGPDGVKKEIRNDLDHMISAGHVTAASIRWEGISQTPRVNLPIDHPFFVDREATPDSDVKVHGVFFHEWRALEGSIVGIGADPAALMKMADGKTGEAREFWRGMHTQATCGLKERAEKPVLELDTEPTLRDVMRSIERIDERIDEMEAARERDELTTVDFPAAVLSTDGLGNPTEFKYRVVTTTSPGPDQEPERADQPSAEEADLRPLPTEERLTLSTFLQALRDNRELQREDNRRLLDEARGKVPDVRRNPSSRSASG